MGHSGHIAHNMIYVIDTLVHLHNRKHEADPISDVGKRHSSSYTLTEGRSGSDQMLGNGIYVSTNIINELLMRFNGLFHVLQRGEM
jgi:hypothetical protein